MVEARQVMRLVADVLGSEPLGATHMDFGHMSVTYEVALLEFNGLAAPGRRLLRGVVRAGLHAPLPRQRIGRVECTVVNV